MELVWPSNRVCAQPLTRQRPTNASSSIFTANAHFYKSSINQNLSNQLRAENIWFTSPFIKNKKPGQHLLPRAANDPTLNSSDIYFRKIQRIIRLNSAIKNRSIKELLELIRDECKEFCTTSNFHPYQLLKKVAELLHCHIVKSDMRFVIKPTATKGLDFGFDWNLAWNDIRMPIGLGCSFCVSHCYKGTAYIRNTKGLYEPLLQVGLGTKLEELSLLLIDKIVPKGVLNDKQRAALSYYLLSAVFMAAFYLFVRNTPM